MDSFEKTKVAGAVLAALLVIVGTRTLINEHSAEGKVEGGYALGEGAKVASKESPGKNGEMPAATAAADNKSAPAAPAAEAKAGGPAPTPAGAASGVDFAKIAEQAASGNADGGKATFSKCKSCHNADKNGANQVGPNLWGIVGRPRASKEGFGYSDAMKAKGGTWTLSDLAAFIYKPKAAVPGTKMLFNGIDDPGAVSDLLAYLRTLSDK